MIMLLRVLLILRPRGVEDEEEDIGATSREGGDDFELGIMCFLSLIVLCLFYIKCFEYFISYVVL
ncbi:hypothetical protein RND81_08G158100 [Saponaria officinalis]|uniref:Uncharacterized protein n=1 Tax=Saponaria officinalis TaxID=3572 RepID=A0AAW1J727_SAPOF